MARSRRRALVPSPLVAAPPSARRRNPLANRFRSKQNGERQGRGTGMLDLAVLMAWLEFAVRWTHVITAIAWIGSSFYFIALDLGLHRDRNLASGADGEEWQV